MSAPAGVGESPNYLVGFLALARRSAVQLVRPPSHSRRAMAARRLARRALMIAAIGGVAVIALMVGFDVREIGMMPPRRLMRREKAAAIKTMAHSKIGCDNNPSNSSSCRAGGRPMALSARIKPGNSQKEIVLGGAMLS